MGDKIQLFFWDLKEDLSHAVNELMPAEEIKVSENILCAEIFAERAKSKGDVVSEGDVKWMVKSQNRNRRINKCAEFY